MYTTYLCDDEDIKVEKVDENHLRIHYVCKQELERMDVEDAVSIGKYVLFGKIFIYTEVTRIPSSRAMAIIEQLRDEMGQYKSDLTKAAGEQLRKKLEHVLMTVEEKLERSEVAGRGAGRAVPRGA